MNKKQIYIYSFYRFKRINNLNPLQKTLHSYLKNKEIKGTILIAEEGINGSISGLEDNLEGLINLIKQNLNIRKISLKKNICNFIPFYRLKVKIKKEIVSLGINNVNSRINHSTYVNATKWNKLILDSKVNILDVRNKYETKIGKFKNSIDFKSNSFREFPKIFKSLEIGKDETIAMYCTGGIRCEKASSYLFNQGYKNIVQLNGGIINYLQEIKNKGGNLWKGDCFVFDNRVAIDKNLKPGKYFQCHGCRHPITKKDMQSKKFKKGVYCPYCFNTRTKKQIKSSETRQKQIDLAEQSNLHHNFKKVYQNQL